jgi:hypothetical protein
MSFALRNASSISARGVFCVFFMNARDFDFRPDAADSRFGAARFAATRPAASAVPRHRYAVAIV